MQHSTGESWRDATLNITMSLESDSSVMGLGTIIKSSMSSKEVSDAISKLANGQKYKLLKEY